METLNQKPLIEATGGIHIGISFMKSFQASWPFGKIKIYEKILILKIQYIPNFIINLFKLHAKAANKMGLPNLGSSQKIPKEIQLQYNEIKGYKEKNLSIGGYGITLVHQNTQYPPFLQVWISKKNAVEIIKFLNSKGIKKIEQL